MVRNITEKFETNEQIKRMNRELKNARDQAMAASEAKSRFLARMSHEFRTPLNAALGYTELLLEHVDDLEPEKMASDLEHIQTSGEQLQRLIGDVLDLTKIDSGRLELDIAETIEGLTTTLQPMLDENGWAAASRSTVHPARKRPSHSNCRPNWTRTRRTTNRSNPRRLASGGISDLSLSDPPLRRLRPRSRFHFTPQSPQFPWASAARRRAVACNFETVHITSTGGGTVVLVVVVMLVLVVLFVLADVYRFSFIANVNAPRSRRRGPFALTSAFVPEQLDLTQPTTVLPER